MKVFIDTANIEEIREANSYGILDGVTTNPTLLAKEMNHPQKQLEKICEIVKGPVSTEVTALKAEEMVKEAQSLAKIGENIVIKIPSTIEGLKATRELTSQGIKTNLTLCFSPSQALLIAKAGATYVSPFVGRLDDISSNGMRLIKEIKQIYMNYNLSTQIIVASIRHPMHFVEAALIGADIATVPFSVIEKLMKHPLTDIGIDKFIKDWEKLQNLL